MATTPNLNLPLIDENTVNDVPRDFNALAEAVDTAVMEAVEGVTVPDASLTEKGIVQLSNATNGTRENVAATEKAVGQAFQAGNERKAEVVAALVAIGIPASTSETWAQLIPKIAAVIRATGNATAADILAGKVASNASGPVTGTMPHLTGIRTATGTAKWGDGALAVYPEKGYQKGGSGDGEIKVTTAQLQGAEPNLNSAYILSGRPIFGVPGGIANRSAENEHMPSINKTVWPGDRYFMCPPAGYYNGLTWVTAAEPQLRPENIRANTTIGTITGTLSPGGRSLVTNFTPEKNIPSQNTWLISDLFVIPPSGNYVDVFTTKSNTTNKIEAYTISDDYATVKTAALALIDGAGVMHILLQSRSGGADVRRNLTGFQIDRKGRTGIMYNATGMGDPPATAMPSIPANFNLLGQIRFCAIHMYEGYDIRPIARSYATDLVVVTT